jgi:hypothetical protein
MQVLIWELDLGELKGLQGKSIEMGEFREVDTCSVELPLENNKESNCGR